MMNLKSAQGSAGARRAATLALIGLIAALIALSVKTALSNGPYAGALLLASVTGLIGLIAGAFGFKVARDSSAKADKLSQDLDSVSSRLIRLESQSGNLPDFGFSPDDLRSSISGITEDIGVLGNLIKDIAETVASHERQFEDLSQPVPAAYAPPAPPVVVRPSSPPVNDPLPVAAPVMPVPMQRNPQEEREEAIRQAFLAEQVELHLQAIVSLPQRKPRIYENLARLKLDDGQLLAPADFLPVLERHGLIAQLDEWVVGRSLLIARHLQSKGSEASVTCNISGSAFSPQGHLRSIIRIVEAHGDVAARFALEVPQRVLRTLDPSHAGLLATLSRRGVRLALDRAIDLRIDPMALAERGVRFVKLPVSMLLDAHAAQGLDIATGDLALMLARAGIDLVAERVESEEQVHELLDLDVPLAQGQLFAVPKAVRNEIFTQAQTLIPQGNSTLEQQTKESWQPYRSQLRRASA